MLLAARHQKAILQKFGLQDMWTNYTNGPPKRCCRITGHYFFGSLENVRGLSDDPPARLGMRLFDAMWDSEDLNAALACAKRYF